MTTVAFDTHKAVKSLKAAGVEEAHAEAFVETFGGALNDSVATKGDIAALGKEIVALNKELRGEMRELEQRMTIRLGGIMIAGIGFLVVLDRLFPVVAP